MRISPLIAALLATLPLCGPAVAALAPAEKKIAAEVDRDKERNIAFLAKIVDINSGTRNFAGVAAVAQVLKGELDGLGFVTEWVPMTDRTGRAGHLTAVHKGSGRGRRMLLIAHMDTVFEKDSPFQTFSRKGDVAIGPGVYDTKGGIAIMIAALRAMKAAGTLNAADIRIVLSGDEESPGVPQDLARARMIADAKWADAAFEFEGMTLEDGKDTGSIARRGAIMWTLTVTGKGAHSSGVFAPGVGFGANYELVRILDAFRRDLREPNLTYNVGLMLGGVAVDAAKVEPVAGSANGKPNIVAEKAIATGDIRALSSEQARRIEQKMQAIVADHLPGTGGEIHFNEGYPPMPPTPGARALLAQVNAINRDLGQPELPELDPMKRGGGDISFAAPYVDGLVGTGMGGAGAHAEGESADLTSLPRQAKRMAILMSRMALQPPIKKR